MAARERIPKKNRRAGAPKGNRHVLRDTDDEEEKQAASFAALAFDGSADDNKSD